MLFTAFHEVGFKQKLVLSPVVQHGVVLPNVVLRDNGPQVFHVAKLEDIGEVEGEKKRQSWGPAFSEQLCESALFDTMHESLQLVRSGRRAWKRGRVDLNTSEFSISPGKMTFLSQDRRNQESTTYKLAPRAPCCTSPRNEVCHVKSTLLKPPSNIAPYAHATDFCRRNGHG